MNVLQAFNALNINQLSATKTEIKKAYKKSAFKYHPDRNKSGTQSMQIINNAYNYLLSLDSETIDVRGFNEEKIVFNDFTEELNTALNSIIDFTDLVIEVCGIWVWVSGETSKYKDILKLNGFKYISNKKMWAFHPKNKKTTSRGDYDFEKIRETYGNSIIHKNKNGMQRISA